MSIAGLPGYSLDNIPINNISWNPAEAGFLVEIDPRLQGIYTPIINAQTQWTTYLHSP